MLFIDHSMKFRINCFRQHEWEKHGTCALSLKQIRNERDYFQITLGLREKYDFGVLLEKLSIVPDDNKGYELEEIISGIRTSINFEPVVYCYVDQESNKQFLAEMQVCLNRNFEVIECTSQEKRSLTTMVRATEQVCNSNMPVFYPVLNWLKDNLI